MSKKITAWTICLFIIAFAALAWAHGDQYNGDKKYFTKHFNQTAFDITPKALYSVEVLPNNKEFYLVPVGTVGIVIHNDKDEDVKRAKLIMAYKNLDSGKVIKPTRIYDKLNGLYIVKGLGDITQQGHWELDVTVNVNGVEDSVKFKLPDAFEKPYPQGEYSP